MATLQQLKVGTGWIELEAIGEPEVLLTFRGYAPVLPVRQVYNDLQYYLFINAKSLAEPLERLRAINLGKFTGLRFSIRKESEDQRAKYEVQDGTQTS